MQIQPVIRKLLDTRVENSRQNANTPLITKWQ